MAIPESLQKNLKLPVIAAPMFLVSGPELVIETCKNGMIGTFPALNERTTEGFDNWLEQIKAAGCGTEYANYGVNLIVHQSNPRCQEDLKVCVKHKVPLIITSLGAVSELVDTVHSYGGLVFHDVTQLRHARKAIKAGVDGLILVCAGAGGHAGTLNPFPFLDEIRAEFDGTIILAGCLSTGRQVAATRLLGADFAYLGTRFINTTESRAMDSYKQMIIDSAAADVIYTPAVSGVPGSFLAQSLQNAGFPMEKLSEMKKKIDFGSELSQAESEAKAWKTIFSAGQGVGAIDKTVSVKELYDELKRDYEDALNSASSLI